MARRLRPALLSAVLLLNPLPAAAQPAVRDLCTPVDAELTELSGLATDDHRLFAISDGGNRLRVMVLNPADCTVLDTITARVDPYDVEDLARGRDGALWLADTGDNDLRRSTVALHRLTLGGRSSLYRLTYPDGPHDVEALLLDQADVPYLVTKELNAARVYRPTVPLAEPGPTPLEQVATVQITPSDTPGGPAGRLGSVLVTGGAVGADGQVVALRTYTDAYLFAAPDGDILAALATEPVRIPLPGEPQGEAVALGSDGTLLSGSEAQSSPTGLSGSAGAAGPSTAQRGAAKRLAPIRAVPGATGLLARSMPAPREGSQPIPGSAAPAGDAGFPLWRAGAVVGGLVALLALLVACRNRRTR